MTRTSGRRRRLFLLTATLAILAIASLGVGPISIGPSAIADALYQGMTGKELTDRAAIVVWEIRLPTMLTALFAGAALGAAGLLMQTYFRNPLAGPDVMGVSAGASLGVALVTLAKGSSAFLPQGNYAGQLGVLTAASLGALAVLLLALLAARWYDDALTLLVLGLMFAALAMGVVGLIAHFARAELLQDYVRWTFGSFDGSWMRLPLFAALTAVGLVASLAVVKPLNALQLGSETAEALGVRLLRVRLFVLGTAAVLAGTTTAVCGPIAFLGVAAPHLARVTFRTSDHRWLMPGSVVTGAALAIAIDIAAKTLASPAMLPINTVSGVLGAPLVIWVVLRWRPRS
jgi:iron complex transport system permease protein